MKTRSNHRVSVLKSYLFVLVCLLVKVCCLYLFFFSTLGCCLYVDFYGILVLRDAFLARKTKAFTFQRKKVYLGDQMLPEQLKFHNV